MAHTSFEFGFEAPSHWCCRWVGGSTNPVVSVQQDRRRGHEFPFFFFAFFSHLLSLHSAFCRDRAHRQLCCGRPEKRTKASTVRLGKAPRQEWAGMLQDRLSRRPMQWRRWIGDVGPSPGTAMRRRPLAWSFLLLRKAATGPSVSERAALSGPRPRSPTLVLQLQLASASSWNMSPLRTSVLPYVGMYEPSSTSAAPAVATPSMGWAGQTEKTTISND